MNYLLIIFLFVYIYTMLFSDIKINNKKVTNIFKRIIPCLLMSLVTTLIFGVPILGIMFLLFN